MVVVAIGRRSGRAVFSHRGPNRRNVTLNIEAAQFGEYPMNSLQLVDGRESNEIAKFRQSLAIACQDHIKQTDLKPWVTHALAGEGALCLPDASFDSAVIGRLIGPIARGTCRRHHSFSLQTGPGMNQSSSLNAPKMFLPSRSLGADVPAARRREPDVMRLEDGARGPMEDFGSPPPFSSSLSPSSQATFLIIALPFALASRCIRHCRPKRLRGTFVADHYGSTSFGDRL